MENYSKRNFFIKQLSLLILIFFVLWLAIFYFCIMFFVHVTYIFCWFILKILKKRWFVPVSLNYLIMAPWSYIKTKSTNIECLCEIKFAFEWLMLYVTTWSWFCRAVLENLNSYCYNDRFKVLSIEVAKVQ